MTKNQKINTLFVLVLVALVGLVVGLSSQLVTYAASSHNVWESSSHIDAYNARPNA